MRGVARVPRRHTTGTKGSVKACEELQGFREGIPGVARVPRRHARGSSGFREGKRGVVRVPRRHATGTKGSVKECEDFQGLREGIPRVPQTAD